MPKMGSSSTSRRRRPAEALADVEDVGDDEDDEDGRLGDDQAGHAHGAAVGQRPRRSPAVADRCSRSKSLSASLIIRSPSQDLPDASDPTAAGGC